MKVLFVTNEIPYPPDNGVRIVSYNAMRLMKESGHQLGLAVLTEEHDDLHDRFNKIKRFCEVDSTFLEELIYKNKFFTLIKSFVCNKIYPIERYNSNDFRSKLIELIEKFKPDVIHFDVITMTQYIDIVPEGIGTVASINDSYCLTLENLFSNGQYKGLQYIYRKLQYYQTRHYERTIYPKFDKVHVMTQIDANFLESLNPNISTSVIPNGVTSNLFHIVDDTINKFDIIFVAKLVGDNLYSLQEFLKLSWPYIHEFAPDVKLHIVGQVTDEAIELKNKYNNLNGVCFLGYIEKLEDAYSSCGIAIVPVNKNCGLINKAIEAMAAGLAVVGFESSFSSLTGAVDRQHYISVKDFKSIADAVIELLNNDNLLNELKVSAHEFAVDNYSWESRIVEYENMYNSCIQKK
ncbi:MAG: glycosyltransferase family 4 protein [Pseudomonadota bacterium]